MTSAKTISESGYTESNGGQGFSLSFAGDTIQLTTAPPGIFALFCFPCVCLFPPKMTFSMSVSLIDLKTKQETSNCSPVALAAKTM